MATGNNNARRRKIREGRLLIVAEMYKKGVPIAKIAEEVKLRMNTSCSKRTIWNDINILLKEWRESRLENMDLALQLELERIDDSICELWKQWEKSKEDYIKQQNKRVGIPMPADAGDGDKTRSGESIITIKREQKESNIIGLGDPRYIAEIRQQLAERRKLLGLYASTRTEITGKDGKDLIPTSEMTREEIMAEIERIRGIRDDK